MELIGSILLFVVGAAVALFSYHIGRNNKSPVPPIRVPFMHTPAGSGVDLQPKQPVQSRGM